MGTKPTRGVSDTRNYEGALASVGQSFVDRCHAEMRLIWTTEPNDSFRRPDAAIDEAVAAFIGQVESSLGKWDAVAPTYMIQRVLLALCVEMSEFTDDPVVRDYAGPALMKLSNALADYRDSPASGPLRRILGWCRAKYSRREQAERNATEKPVRLHNRRRRS